jgi:hypothetical protein
MLEPALDQEAFWRQACEPSHLSGKLSHTEATLVGHFLQAPLSFHQAAFCSQVVQKDLNGVKGVI